MEISNSSYKKVVNTQLLLQWSYGLLYIVAGLDKFFNIIVTWEKYISPLFMEVLHVDNLTLKIIIALFEIGLGILLLTKWTRAGAYLTAAWLMVIIVDLLTIGGYLDIVVRDAMLAIGALALARLTEVKQAA